MKKALLLWSILSITALNGMNETQSQNYANNLPHIILFVDLNKSIIAESSRKGAGYGEIIAGMLALATEYAHTWDDLETTTYCKWVDEKMFPGSDKNPVLKKECETQHTKFIEAVKDRKHPMSQEIIDEYNSLTNALKTQSPRKVFASFSNLINYLRENNYSFSVVLRTFGRDLNGVAQELTQYDNLNFIYGSFDKGMLKLNEQTVSDPVEIIAAFEPEKHYAIQDSYDWWKQNNFKEKGGKPFPININDKQTLSIFFDDNADDPVRQILNIIPVGTTTNLDELITMGRVVTVDTRKAILNKNYFINAFKNALEKWQETYNQQNKEKTYFQQQK